MSFNRTDWLDENGAFKMLHKIHPIRMKWLSSYDFKCKEVLDIGCGGGIISKSLKKLGANVIGIDESFLAIESAKSYANDITFINTSFEEFDTSDFFDAIVAFEVIEHVTNQKKFLSKIINLLKPGGSLFLSTINKTSESYLKAILVAEHILGIIPKHTHQFEKFISPFEILQIIKNHMTIEDLKGMSLNILKREFYLSNSAKVNYFLKAIKKN